MGKITDFCFVGIRYEKTYPIVTMSSMAMTRNRTEIPLELRIAFNQAKLSPPLVGGDEGEGDSRLSTLTPTLSRRREREM